MKQCPCGTGKSYQNCCGAFIDGLKIPVTPEELMRSRYTAYTLANIAYITRTMKAPANDNFNATSAYEWARSVKWIKLKVIKASQQGTKGYVEFIAHFEEHQQKQALHELSEFHLIDGAWFYVSGKIPTMIE